MTPCVRTYAEQIATIHNVTVGDIFARTRCQRAARARGDIMARLRADGFSLKQIGNWVGRDHTTVLYWLRRDGLA